MDNFNKIISFVLGLIVVIVFLLVITGKFNLKNKINILGNKTVPSLTPTPIITQVVNLPSPTAKVSAKVARAKTIPSTGSPTLLLPLFFSSLASGIYLRNKGKKD